MLGATFFVVLQAYAERLAAVDGRLYLSGVDPDLLEQYRRVGRVDARSDQGVPGDGGDRRVEQAGLRRRTGVVDPP